MSMMNVEDALVLLNTLCHEEESEIQHTTIGADVVVEPVISFPIDEIQTQMNNDHVDIMQVDNIDIDDQENDIIGTFRDVCENPHLETAESELDCSIANDDTNTEDNQTDLDNHTEDNQTDLDNNTEDNQTDLDNNTEDNQTDLDNNMEDNQTDLDNNTEDNQTDLDNNTEDNQTDLDNNTEDNQTDLDNNTEDDHTENIDKEVKRPSRKRKRDEHNWKRNIRKRKCEHGEEYTNSKGLIKRARELKNTKDCSGKCKYKCSLLISENERQNYFKEFWSKSYAEKNVFYSQTTEKCRKERTRTKTQSSRRNYSYKYFFLKEDGHKVRVCKDYYLATLDISQKRITRFYETTEIQQRSDDKRGKQTKRKIPEDDIEFIKTHINSFPRIPGHYCRKSSQREYLEADLTMAKMYNLYKTQCESCGREPVKKYLYRKIFNEDFNIGFYVPKKDRCDLCEEFRASNNADSETNDEVQAKYDRHINDKTQTKEERDNDRKCKDKMVICFDMQNVLTCPRSNVSNFFYKRKLNVFNLTAHCSLDKKNYNALWHEGVAGRGANEIASALTAILDSVCIKHNRISNITLWSDSCVPQNRNSIMTYALKKFLSDHPNIYSIEQKFGTPGHSPIQEVDNVHSHFEKALKKAEIFSPVSLLRLLTKVRPSSTKVLQLRPEHFMDFQKASKTLKFNQVPYARTKTIKIKNAKPFHVEYKTSFEDLDYQEKHIIAANATRSKKRKAVQNLPKVDILKNKSQLSKEKKLDIKSMLRYMPPQDKQL